MQEPYTGILLLHNMGWMCKAEQRQSTQLVSNVISPLFKYVTTQFIQDSLTSWTTQRETYWQVFRCALHMQVIGTISLQSWPIYTGYPIHFWVQFKVLVLTSKALHSLGPMILKDHLLPYELARLLQLSSEVVALGAPEVQQRLPRTGLSQWWHPSSPQRLVCPPLLLSFPSGPRTLLFHLGFTQWSLLSSLYFNHFYVFTSGFNCFNDAGFFFDGF